MHLHRRSGIVPIVILLIAVFGAAAVSTGAVYWVKQGKKKSRVSSTPQPTLDFSRAQTPTLEATAEHFDGASLQKPSFTMHPPAGWVRPTDTKVEADFVFSAPEPDLISPQEGFFSNITASVGPHQPGYTGINDYRTRYKKTLLAALPGTQVVRENVTRINSFEAYVIESITTPSGNAAMHRLQYLYIINDRFALGALGTTLEKEWSRDGGKIKASLESIQIEVRR